MKKRLKIQNQFDKRIDNYKGINPIGNLEILTANGDSYALHYIDGSIINKKTDSIPSQINVKLDYRATDLKANKKDIVGIATVEFAEYKNTKSNKIKVVFSNDKKFTNNNAARWKSYEKAYISKKDFKNKWIKYQSNQKPTLTVVVESLKDISLTKYVKEQLDKYPKNSYVLPDGTSIFEKINTPTDLTKFASKSKFEKEFTASIDTDTKENVKDVIEGRNKIKKGESTVLGPVERALDEIESKDEYETTADLLNKEEAINSKMQETYKYFTPPEHSLKINAKDLNESIFEAYKNYVDEINRDMVAYKAEIATDRFKPLPSKNGNIAWHNLTEEERKDVINGKYPGPFMHDEILEAAVTLRKGGIALYGPPGTGKSEQIVRVGQEIGQLYGVKVHEIQPDCNYETLFPKKTVIDDVDEDLTVAKTDLDESKGIYKYIRNGGVLIFNEYSQIDESVQTVFSEFLTKSKDSVGRVIDVNGIELRVHKNFWIFATLNRPEDTIGKVQLSNYISDRFKIFDIGNSFDAFMNSAGLANAAHEQITSLIPQREIANSGEEYYSIRNILKNHVGRQNQRAIVDYIHKKNLREIPYETLTLDLLSKNNQDLIDLSDNYEVSDDDIEKFISACNDMAEVFHRRQKIAKTQATKRNKLKGVASLSADFEQLYHAIFSHSINPEFALWGTKDGEQIYYYMNDERLQDMEHNLLLFVGTPIEHYKKSLSVFKKLYDDKKDKLPKDIKERVDMTLLKASKLQEILKLKEKFFQSYSDTNKLETLKAKSKRSEEIARKLNEDQKKILHSKNWGLLLTEEYEKYKIANSKDMLGYVDNKHDFFRLLKGIYNITKEYSYLRIDFSDIALSVNANSFNPDEVTKICALLNIAGHDDGIDISLKNILPKNISENNAYDNTQKREIYSTFAIIMEQIIYYILEDSEKSVAQRTKSVLSFKNKKIDKIKEEIEDFCFTYGDDDNFIATRLDIYFTRMRDILYSNIRNKNIDPNDYIYDVNNYYEKLGLDMRHELFIIFAESDSYISQTLQNYERLPLLEYIATNNDTCEESASIFSELFNVYIESEIDDLDTLLLENYIFEENTIEKITQELENTNMIEFASFKDDDQNFKYPQFKKYAWYNFEQENRNLEN